MEIDARNPPRDLVCAAISRGCKLNVPQLDKIIHSKGVALPENGTGHKGNLVKIDKATCLVKALFPDASADEHKRMITQIMGRLPPVSPRECPEELLDIISQLDPDNVQGFQQVTMTAGNENNPKELSFKRTCVTSTFLFRKLGC